MSRRRLAVAALATAGLTRRSAPAQEKKGPVYAGALDGFTPKVDANSFDPVHWTRTLHESAPLRMRFRARDRKQAEAWQRRLGPKLVELIGGFPATRTPLRPQTLEVREFPKYRREKVVFETRPGVAALAYLLTPAGARGPLPAMICVPGHGRGVDDIVGIDAEGKDRTNKAGYQHDFAIQAVEHGMAAIAIEPMAFGCRRDPITKRRGLGNSACQPAAGAALLLGETMIGWRVWDVMRTIDWVETRPELDRARVGCMGISGGGTCTLFSTALEPRIRVAFISGYMNTFRDSVLSLSHCIDNYVPGILRWAEMPDIAGLIAPRPLFIESGDRDNIFPIAASRAAFEQVREVYKVFGSPELVAQEVFSGEHSFHGAAGLPFVARHLGASPRA